MIWPMGGSGWSAQTASIGLAMARNFRPGRARVILPTSSIVCSQGSMPTTAPVDSVSDSQSVSVVSGQFTGVKSFATWAFTCTL